MISSIQWGKTKLMALKTFLPSWRPFCCSRNPLFAFSSEITWWSGAKTCLRSMASPLIILSHWAEGIPNREVETIWTKNFAFGMSVEDYEQPACFFADRVIKNIGGYVGLIETWHATFKEILVSCKICHCCYQYQFLHSLRTSCACTCLQQVTHAKPCLWWVWTAYAIWVIISLSVMGSKNHSLLL